MITKELEEPGFKRSEKAISHKTSKIKLAFEGKSNSGKGNGGEFY